MMPGDDLGGPPFVRELFGEWPADDGYDDVDEEPLRCEAGSDDGGVCLRVLRRDGSCPRHG